jgi:hypothetical protein
MPSIMIPTIVSKSFAMLLALSGDGILGTPPLADDFSLAMRIENATDPELGPGARAILAFDVRHFGPTDFSQMYIVNWSEIPLEPNQPIRLSNAPGSDCDFSAYDSVNPNVPGWRYVVTREAPPFGIVQTCKVLLEVLEPARSGFQVQFFVGAVEPGLWFDPEIRNNSVFLRVGGGQAIDAVPVRGTFALMLLGLCVIAAGLTKLARNSRGSPQPRDIRNNPLA